MHSSPSYQSVEEKSDVVCCCRRICALLYRCSICIGGSTMVLVVSCMITGEFFHYWVVLWPRVASWLHGAWATLVMLNLVSSYALTIATNPGTPSSSFYRRAIKEEGLEGATRTDHFSFRMHTREI